MVKIVLPPREFLIWFTGFWEGDGWSNFCRGKNGGVQTTVAVCQSEYGVMKTLDRNFNVGFIYKRERKGKARIVSKKPIYIYTISGIENCRILLTAMLPFMRIGSKIIKTKKTLAELNKIELNANHWSESENKFLIKNFEQYSDSQLGSKIGRTTLGVCARRLKFGLKKTKKNYRHWTDKEIETLRINFDLPYKELCCLLPSHKFTSISSMKYRLGLGRQKRSKKKLDERWASKGYKKAPSYVYMVTPIS